MKRMPLLSRCAGQGFGARQRRSRNHRTGRGLLCLIAALLLALEAGAEAPREGLQIRPGMTAFSTLKGRQEPRYTSEDVAGPLTELCPNLLALDLGHNDVHDLSFLRAWPHLRRLIIVDSKTPVTDISPLAELNDLEYVELFLQNITDLTPLAGKTRLIDLNLAHNDITDLTPLHSCTGLKRLWISYNHHLSQQQLDAFHAAVPDCQIVTGEWNSTGRGWRETAQGPVPHYQILMDSFRSGEYIPFADSAPLEESGAAALVPETAEKELETPAPRYPTALTVTGGGGADSVVTLLSGEKKGNGTVMLRNGGSFVYVVREDGGILGWGDNRRGQLGTTPAKLFLDPRPVADGIDGSELADIQCGNENTLFLKKDGTVWTCGTYSRGTQGLGRLDRIVKEPTRIPGLERIVQISCGFGHNAALDVDGRLWVWGRNDCGQLGLGDRSSRNTPVMLPLEGIASVTCGGKFTLAQDREGILWGWGTNAYQVLKAGKAEYVLQPERLAGLAEKTILSFAGGSDCAFFLDDQGVIWTRGRNEYKQLGSSAAAWKSSGELTTVDIPEKVRTVCAYSAATAALTESGNVYIWGSVSAGQLGTGKSPNGTLPVLVWSTGDAEEVAMGSLISSIRTRDGKIHVSGYNAYGQLGNGSKRSSNKWVWNGTTVGDN